MKRDVLVEREKPCHGACGDFNMHIHHYQEIMAAFRSGNPFRAFQILMSYEGMVKLLLEKEEYKTHKTRQRKAVRE